MQVKLSRLLVVGLALSAGNAQASGCVDTPWGVSCSGNAATVTSAGSLPVVVQNDFSVAMEAAHPVEEMAAVAQTGAFPDIANVGLECAWASSSLNGDTSACTLPLSYTIHNEIDPRRRLILKMPVTIIDTATDQAWHVGFGASYTYPMAARWYVTPGVNYTYASEGDFNQKADLVSATLASAYFYKHEGFDIGVGNMIGYAHTVNETGGVNAHPEYHYSILRNGLMAAKAGTLFGRKVYWEGSVVDTLFFGSQAYTNHQLEASLTVGDKRSYKASAGGYRFGVSLFDASGGTHGGRLTFGYWF